MATSAPKNAANKAVRVHSGDPCVFVIFGATGDLTKRLLMPSLYNLLANKLLPDRFAIVGVSNVKMSSEDFRKQLGDEIKQFATTTVRSELWKWFDQRISYMSGDFKDPATYTSLKSELESADRTHGTPGNYLFYTAVSPSFFGEIVKQLARAGLTKETDGHWRRVIVEKPFGHDLESANALNREIGACIREDQTFRIDHYLGKETVQNIMAFRFGNGIFEPLWNNSYIDHVQITVAETVGVEHRGAFYESTGALRDMVPNHILALVSLTAMEPPNSFDSEPVRDEKTKVLRAIRPLNPDDVPKWAVRGQYGPGTLDGKQVAGYRLEPQVDPKSGTESYVAMKLAIDNWRWAGVPFYLRTGKRMAKRVTEIAIKFKAPPALLFRQTGVRRLEQNELVLHIQPNEGISLSFSAKIPGPVVRLGGVDMNFKYADYFGAAPSIGYETLLLDCMIGDPTLFQRADTVDAGWRVVDPILAAWKASPANDFPDYAAGSWGPRTADELLQRDGRKWRET
ncbi:MAG: glucose-6-phosphate dehydrogenase [Candidatus Binatus sp.]